jgi:hypothetical protein
MIFRQVLGGSTRADREWLIVDRRVGMEVSEFGTFPERGEEKDERASDVRNIKLRAIKLP